MNLINCFKIFSISIIHFVCAIVCVAQTNYYAETKTFNESNYTYKAEVSSHGYVKLYNTANLWMNTESVYKDTGTIFNMPDYGIDLFDDDSWLDSKKQVANVVNSSFSNAEKQRIQDVYFFIIMHINSTTGYIDDVYFEFDNTEPYATIPVSVYRNIELEIKEKVRFTLTNEGKKLNYIYYWNDIVPK